MLAAVHVGGWFFDAILIIAAGLMAREWGRMAEGGRLGALSMLLAIGVMSEVALITLTRDSMAAGLYVTAGLTVAIWLVAAVRRSPAPLWLAGGVVPIALPCVAFGWLRYAPGHGAATVYWILAVVWATDIGAFAAGRLIGGPKLAPRISPNKTWAGLAGGVVASIVAGTLVAELVSASNGTLIGVASGGLALVAQGGDLTESFFKRHFGVKDTGRLIPGHGGLLDRVDGLLAVALVVALAGWSVEPRLWVPR